ncbi:MAG: SPASM domain-containing protein [Bacteroidales bacterium]|nr:SPASM domain-containing protein [Bacteroidales bacterium]
MDNLLILRNGDNYLLYNIEKHVSVLIDEISFLIVKLYIQNNMDLEKLLQNIPDIKKKHAKSLICKLQDINMFNNEINDEILFENHIPSQYYLHLTYRCNLNCSYCYNKDIRNNFIDMPIEEWEIIINKLNGYAKHVVLTGGEPFLYSNIGLLSQMLHNNKIYVEIISNGMLDLCHKYDNVIGNIDRITFSCDNFNDKNQLRLGFCVETLIKNINYIKKNFEKVKIAISSTLYKDNLIDQKKVASYCIDNNIDFRSVLLVPNSPCEMKYLPSVKAYKESLSKGFYDITTKRVHCGAAVNVISIAPNGDVYPCQNLHYDEFKIGNILNTSINTLMKNKVMKFFRKELRVYNIKKCNKCDFKYICGGGCRAATYRLENDILGHPSHMCSYYKENAINRLYNYNKFDLEQIIDNKETINQLLTNTL